MLFVGGLLVSAKWQQCGCTSSTHSHNARCRYLTLIRPGLAASLSRTKENKFIRILITRSQPHGVHFSFPCGSATLPSNIMLEGGFRKRLNPVQGKTFQIFAVYGEMSAQIAISGKELWQAIFEIWYINYLYQFWSIIFEIKTDFRLGLKKCCLYFIFKRTEISW